MPSTPLLSITYPAENQDPYWTTAQSTWLAIDNWLGATREDGMIHVTGGGSVTATGGNVTWTADLHIYFPLAGSRVVVSANTVACADGEFLYITVPTRPVGDQTLTMSAGSNVPTVNDIVIGMRIGYHVYLRGQPLPFAMESHFLPIDGAMDGLTAAPAAAALHTISWGQVTARKFDSAAIEDVVYQWGVPLGWFGYAPIGLQFAVDFVITEAVAPAATEGIHFDAAIRSYADGDSLNQGAPTWSGVSISDLSGNSQHDRVVTPWTNMTWASVAEGHLANLYLRRDPTHADDDYVQDVGVTGLWVRYARRLRTEY